MAPLRILTLLCTFLLLLLQPLTSAAQQGTRAEQRAESAVNEGRYGEALSILQTTITPETRDARLFLLRARAYEGREEYPRAIADYQRALELDPNNAVAQEGLRRTRTRSGQSGRTDLESLRRLAAANPNNLQLQLQYTDALYEAGLYREAADAYETYLKRTQGTPDILQRYLISIASYEGDNDRGERVASHYLEFYPTDPDLHMRLGYFRLWQGDFAGSIQAFEQSLRLNPNDGEAQRGLQQARAQQQSAPRGAAAAARPAQQTSSQQAPSGQAPAQQAGYPIDRLMRELEQSPTDEKRFRLVALLLEADRYFEAYEQLMRLASRHDNSERWLGFFVRADRGLIRTTGSSPMYIIDRLVYLLRANPADVTLRYQLVDALLEAGRAAEASDVLTARPALDSQDERYRSRMRSIAVVREQAIARRTAELETRLQRQPNDVEALRELASLYAQAQRPDDALELYRLVLAANPQPAIRYDYARLLLQQGRHADALAESNVLLQRDGTNPDYQKLYVMAAIASGRTDNRADQYAASLLQQNPDDVELLLDLSALRLAKGEVEEADQLIRRAHTVADDRYMARVEGLSLLIERELIQLEEAQQFEVLNDARRLAASRAYPQAVEGYEEYFRIRGKRSRAELKELAQVHSASGDFVSALSILEALLAQMPEYDVAKEVAKNRFYLEDYAGTVQVLKPLLQQNPGDFEVRILLGDAYRQLQHYAEARAVYQEAARSATDSELVERRLAALEVASVAGVAQSRPYEGLNYVGLIVPVAEATLARGSGTTFDRWSQGLMTQVTLPISAVLTAGLTSHFLSGTRRLIPGSEIVSERVNQVYAGGYVDLTPSIPAARTNYTNRVTAMGGLFDYEGGRTVGFGEIRYWRQEPGLYSGSIGLRSTEGSVELWSPAGGEFGLRLNQFDIRGGTASVMPDSLLRIGGILAFNLITDNFGSVGTSAGTNQGTSVQLDASYRVIPFTYLGLSYYQLSYRNTVDIYFSPRNYQVYTAWMEYEHEYGDKWYLRVRGSLGAVARSNGFIARRIESDLIYRLARKFSVSVSSSIGQSTRSIGNEASTIDDRYNTFIFAGSLYWTL